MTEIEYIRATNRAKVTAALAVLRDVLPGEDYGITQDHYSVIMSWLYDVQDELFKSYSIEVTPDD